MQITYLCLSDNIIMLCSKIFAPSKSLIFRNNFSLYIYLRDHNKDINPPQSQLKLSYNHPKNLVPNAPKHQLINFKLDPEMEQLLQRQIFQEYKNKILRGIIDEQQVVEADPLWGEGPVPVHHYSNLSKNDLMAVSHPQRLDIENSLNYTYDQYFKTSISEEITIDLIKSCKLSELTAFSLKARSDNVEDGRIWFAIEQRIDRGNKLNLFSHDDLIKLKYAFDGHRKFGTPIFHQILSSLIRQDLPKMNKTELIHLFYACRHSNSGKTNVQLEVLQHLNKFYSTFTFQQKSDFLLALALCNKPIKFQKLVHQRRKHEFKQLASSVVFKLNFWNLELNDHHVRKIIFSLAKLRLSRTKFISLPVLDYINQNFDTFTANRDNLFIATVYLPELQNGTGVGNQQFFLRLRQVVFSKWEQFNKIEQIRLIHTFWNYGLMNQQVFELYKGLQLEADSTLLYYLCQIQLQRSSQREWQVIQLAVQLQVIPLPYFAAFKRFYNYIKSTTQWNLAPLEDKLKNTEYYHNAMRMKDSMEEVKIYTDLKDFSKFAQIAFSTPEAPIQNLQLAHFAYPLHQVSLDIVSKKHFIPGTQKFKQTYLNKARSLSCIGWKHLAYNQQELKGYSLTEYIANIQNAYLPYVQSQQEVIRKQDEITSDLVDLNKTVRQVTEFETKLLNKFFNSRQTEDGIISEDDDQPQIDSFTGQVKNKKFQDPVPKKELPQKDKKKK